MIEFIKILIQALWFFLPAAFANIGAAVSVKVNFLNYPVDFNLKFLGMPIFGSHKTFRGFFFGIATAIIVLYAQTLISSSISSDYLLLDYGKINIFLLGFLFGFGALLGDTIKSFFKRRAGIKPGKSWPVFDQVDWIIGAWIFIGFSVDVPLLVALLALLSYGIAQPAAKYFGRKAGVK